jgi:hypothetical protein
MASLNPYVKVGILGDPNSDDSESEDETSELSETGDNQEVSILFALNQY